jgi:hypothetical protein
MACNCGSSRRGSTRSAGQQVYTAPNGAVTTYSSTAEAQAAVARNGGGSYRPAR